MFPGKFGSLDVVARFLAVGFEDAKKVIAEQKVTVKKFAGKDTYSLDELKVYANKQPTGLIEMQSAHTKKAEKAGRVVLSEKAQPVKVVEVVEEATEMVEKATEVVAEVEEVKPTKARRTSKPKVVTKK